MRVRAGIAGVDEDSAVAFHTIIQAIPIGIRDQRVGSSVGAVHEDTGRGFDSIEQSVIV